MLMVPPTDAPIVAWAHWYASIGWPVFPCYGKRPVTRHGLHDATTEPSQITAWWAQWPDCNIGTPLTEERWALDVDNRHDGLETLRKLEEKHGDLPRTVTSLTGSGGGSHHQIWAGHAVNKAELGPGLDVQGPGSYIILPPSIHPDTHQPYCWEDDFGPDDLVPQEPPTWLVELINQPAIHHNGVTTPPLTGPIPEGRREATLMAIGGAIRRQGGSKAAIRATLEIENERCEPPLDDDALDRMAESLMRYDEIPHLDVAPPVGWSVNGVTSTAIISGIAQTAWRKELFAKKNGELTQNVFNITAILENHDHWQQEDNRLWWDSVRGTPMCGDTEITDGIMLDIAKWFGGAERLPITSPRLLEQCVIARCKKTLRDLLQLWLNSLPAWDGIERLTTWLCQITGMQLTDYIADVSRVLIVSMVARALQPGCHYRFVVILEGPEEIGKSSLVRLLASPQWYVELSLGLETKEAHMMLQGAWIAEFSELDSMSRTEETRLKAFITMREDSYIPKYSNFRQRTERRAIFVGTTNQESYLKGQTGNTRWLPIRLPDAIDLEQFQEIRSQLFAEAIHYYHHHLENWWQMSDEALAIAKEEREQRRVIQVYEQPLHEWLEYGRFEVPILDADGTPVKFLKDETSWQEIAQWFLKIDKEKWKDRSLQMQIGASLTALNWHVRQAWRHGRNMNVWQKDTPDVPF